MKKKNTDRVKHQDLSKMEEQIEEEASFCSLLTVPRAGILWRFCEKYSYFFCHFLDPILCTLCPNIWKCYLELKIVQNILEEYLPLPLTYIYETFWRWHWARMWKESKPKIPFIGWSLLFYVLILLSSSLLTERITGQLGWHHGAIPR